MKRKLIGLAALMVVSTLSLAAIKTTYMMVPSNTQVIYPDESGAKQYVHLMAMDSNGNEVLVSDITVTKSDFYQDDNIEEAHSDLYKISIDNAADDVKLVAGYKIDGKDKYIILSADNANGALLQSRYDTAVSDYETEPTTAEEVFGIVKLIDYPTYSDFPGHVVVDQTLLTVVKAGETISKGEATQGITPDGTNEPSNILEKFYQPPTNGDEITLGAGNKILPTNSFKNYEFTVTYKDENDNDVPIILMKNEGSTNPNFSDFDNSAYVSDGTGKNAKPTGVIDLKKLDNNLSNMENIPLTDEGNLIIFSDTEDNSPYMGPYTIRVHFKNGIHNVPVMFNGAPYTLDKISFIVKDLSIIYGGSGNEFWLDIDEDGITFPPGERPDDAPPKPSGPAVYMVESNGLVMDGAAVINSQTDESNKQRISDVDIKITEAGMSGYQLRRIN